MGSLSILIRFYILQLQQRPHPHFSRNEYLLADSGFSPSKRCIPAVKRPRGLPLERKKRQFNFELSRQRIRIEHAIGILKSRWQSLRELRILIKDERSAARANLWIQACIVLHNYLVDLGDDSIVVYGGVDVGFGEGAADDAIGDGSEDEASPEVAEGNARRDYVYNMFRAT